jgi:hypothetical protein
MMMMVTSPKGTSSLKYGEFQISKEIKPTQACPTEKFRWA